MVSRVELSTFFNTLKLPALTTLKRNPVAIRLTLGDGWASSQWERSPIVDGALDSRLVRGPRVRGSQMLALSVKAVDNNSCSRAAHLAVVDGHSGDDWKGVAII